MGKRKNIITQTEMMAIQNAVTGEMETAKVEIRVSRDVPKYSKEKFTLLFQTNNWIVGRDSSPSACKVLVVLNACVDYGNKIGKTQQEIADHIGYSLRQVERAYAELAKGKVIYKQKNPVDSRMNDWYVNPYQSWKGNVKDRKQRLKERDPNQLGMFDVKDKGIQPSKDF